MLGVYKSVNSLCSRFSYIYKFNRIYFYIDIIVCHNLLIFIEIIFPDNIAHPISFCEYCTEINH